MKVDLKKPDISMAWTPEEMKADGKQELVNLITLLIKKDYEIRIGTDGYCIILEAHNNIFGEESYQWLTEDEMCGRYEDADGEDN